MLAPTFTPDEKVGGFTRARGAMPPSLPLAEQRAAEGPIR